MVDEYTVKIIGTLTNGQKYTYSFLMSVKSPLPYYITIKKITDQTYTVTDNALIFSFNAFTPSDPARTVLYYLST